jgi:hypothetical protein
MRSSFSSTTFSCSFAGACEGGEVVAVVDEEGLAVVGEIVEEEEGRGAGVGL